MTRRRTNDGSSNSRHNPSEGQEDTPAAATRSANDDDVMDAPMANDTVTNEGPLPEPKQNEHDRLSNAELSTSKANNFTKAQRGMTEQQQILHEKGVLMTVDAAVNLTTSQSITKATSRLNDQQQLLQEKGVLRDSSTQQPQIESNPSSRSSIRKEGKIISEHQQLLLDKGVMIRQENDYDDSPTPSTGLEHRLAEQQQLLQEKELLPVISIIIMALWKITYQNNSTYS